MPCPPVLGYKSTSPLLSLMRADHGRQHRDRSVVVRWRHLTSSLAVHPHAKTFRVVLSGRIRAGCPGWEPIIPRGVCQPTPATTAELRPALSTSSEPLREAVRRQPIRGTSTTGAPLFREVNTIGAYARLVSTTALAFSSLH